MLLLLSVQIDCIQVYGSFFFSLSTAQKDNARNLSRDSPAHHADVLVGGEIMPCTESVEKVYMLQAHLHCNLDAQKRLIDINEQQ